MGGRRVGARRGCSSRRHSQQIDEDDAAAVPAVGPDAGAEQGGVEGAHGPPLTQAACCACQPWVPSPAAAASSAEALRASSMPGVSATLVPILSPTS